MGVRRHRSRRPAAELELPQERRRRADPRYVSALALRDREHRSARSRASSPRCRPRRRSASTSAASAYAVDVEDNASTLVELESGAVGTIICSWATRVRRDDLLTFQIDGTGGSAHRRPAPLLDAQPRRETPTIRALQSRHRYQRRLSRRTGRRLPARRPTTIPIGSAGRISCATSSPARRCVCDFAAGIRDVQLAEACYRSAAQQKWIALDDITG